MIAGVYDYIEACREEYGDEYVDKMIASGYEPIMVPGTGWRWMLPSTEDRGRHVLQRVARRS